MRDLIDKLQLLESKDQELTLEPLAYDRADLAPVLSKQNIDYHYGKLAKGYVTRFNEGEGDRDFNRAGAFLHNHLFVQFREPKGSNAPTGAVKELIERKHKSWDDFREAFAQAAMGIQGSGWVYMDSLGEIKTIVNHEIRSDIVLLVDWWEHAWYTDYGPNKAQYLKNIWRIINWDIINARLA